MDRPFIPVSDDTRTPFQRLAAYLTENEWEYQTDEEGKMILTGFIAHQSQFKLIAGINETDDLIQMITLTPNGVPAEKRAEMAELCARLNPCCTMGRLQVDYDDGELTWHMSAPFEPGRLGPHVLRKVLHSCLAMAENLFPAIMSVLFGQTSPREAMERIARLADRDEQDQSPRSLSA